MDRPVIVGRPKPDRPRGKVPCPGHHTDRPGWKTPGDLLCPRCWHALPGETQRLLRAGVPAGAAARRWTVATERLAAGTPLDRLRIDDVPIDDLRLRPLAQDGIEVSP